MKLYILYHTDVASDSDEEVIGIFSTRKLAEKAAEAWDLVFEIHNDHRIEEHIVDAHVERLNGYGKDITKRWPYNIPA